MPNDLEAKSRVKINKLLEEAGWRFFDGEEGKAISIIKQTTDCHF